MKITLAIISLSKYFFLIFISFLFTQHLFAQPTINSFSPASGPVGTTVVITGTNFNPTPANNIVFFGAAKAVVSSATTTSLLVTVPVGATYQPITVTAHNLTAYSAQRFIVTFLGGSAKFEVNSFASGLNISAGSNQRRVCVTDLDGDGKPDMVITNQGSNTISVFRNTGVNTGTVSFTKVDYEAGNGPFDICIGDLDGDGKKDVAVTNFNSGNSSHVSIFRNTSTIGAISFADKIDLETGSGSIGLAIGNLDNDDKPDLVVASGNSGTISIFKNTSSSPGFVSFAPKIDYTSFDHPDYVSINDLEGDGKPDLIVSNFSSSSLSILKNTSSGSSISFASKVDYPAGTYPGETSVGDLDADGRPDIAFTNSTSNTVSILKNLSTDGTISFGEKIEYTTAANPGTVSITDLNGDGKPELAVSNESDPFVSIFTNESLTGNIRFSEKVDFFISFGSTSVSIADLDLDGKPDLVLSNLYSGVTMLRNRVNEPTITLITPNPASAGATVNIKGRNFSTASTVDFGGTPATSFQILADSNITAVLGTGTTGSLNVTNAYGTGSAYFVVIPTFSSFSPSSGPVGTTVTIKGSNFSPVIYSNIVYFGAVQAVVTAATNSTLTVTVPAGATYQPITVTTNGLTVSSQQPFSITFPSTQEEFNPSSFTIKTDFTRSNSPYNIAAADVDGDGKTDIAAVNTGNKISIFRNTGEKGTVLFDEKIDFPADNQPVGLCFSDIDGDGKPDVVVPNYGSNSVSVLKNVSYPGTISFTTRFNFTAGVNPQDVASADLDGDGKPDIAIVNYTDNTLSILKNLAPTPYNGSITFSSKVDYPTGVNPYKVSIADIDGDGKPEVVVLNKGSYTVSVYKNTSTLGSISFAAKIDYVTDSFPQSIAVADMNGDGKYDIIVSNFSPSRLSVFNNTSSTGVISFLPKKDFETNHLSSHFSIADMNGDAKPDIIISNPNSGSVSILKNTSSAGGVSFAQESEYSTDPYPRDVIAVDMNIDGQPDIVTSVQDNFYLSVLRNKINYIPAITSFTPAAAGPGTHVIITGKNFSGATLVTFGGISDTSFTVETDTSITAIVPQGSSGSVEVTTVYGTGTLDGFTFVAPPAITSFTPQAGPVGTVVTINGTNFSSVAANNIVFFGSAKAPVSAAANNTLTVIVPTGASYKPITVTTNSFTAHTSKPFIVTFSGATSAFTQNSFAAKQDIAVTEKPTDVTLIDLDGDGKPDITAACLSSSIILKNASSKGNVAFSSIVDSSIGKFPYQISISDLDGDGNVDLCIGNSQDLNAASIFRNKGTSNAISFDSEFVISLQAVGQFDAANADVDGDGKTDVIIHSLYSQRIWIFRNTTSGNKISFDQPIIILTDAYTRYFTLADINGDNKPELVLSGESVSILKNLSIPGVISFDTKKDITIYQSAQQIAIGDLDGDEKPDLAIANSGNSFIILRNTSANGSITFGEQVSYPTDITGSSKVSISDMDGDGKPDIVVIANPYTDTVWVYKNGSLPGTITFATKVGYGTGSVSKSIDITDIDGDGKPDIATANYNDGTISILLNQIGEPLRVNLCPGGSTALTSGITGTTYQWQIDKGNGFTALLNDSNYTGSATATLGLNNLPSSNYGYQFRCIVDGNVSTVFSVRFSNSWTGTANSAWEDPVNWACGSLPDSNTDVIINSGTAILNSNASCRSIKVNTGATFTVSNGYALTITH